VDEIEWPVCAAHGDDRMTRASDGEEPVALSDEPVTRIDGVPSWWCIRVGHALAR
jgi:hypothetical protein